MATELDFKTIRKRLEEHGWWLDRINGSHHIFKGRNRPSLSIPVHHGKVKAGYGKQVDKAIQSIGKQ